MIGRVAHALWLAIMLLLVAGLYYQYFAVLGLPPDSNYVYRDWAEDHRGRTAFLRWLFLPPLEETIPYENGNRKLPRAWRRTTIIYADFVLLVAVALQLRVVARLARHGRTYWDYVAVESPVGTAARKAKRVFLLGLPWLTDIFLLITCITRNDLICVLYLIVVFVSLTHYRRLITDRVYEVRMWYWHFAAIMTTLFIRFAFILPAGE